MKAVLPRRSPQTESLLPSSAKPLSLQGYKPGKEIALVLDPASSEFYKDGRYTLRTEKKVLTSGEMTDYYQDMISTFPIISIEDGLAEDDWEGWKGLTRAIGSRIQTRRRRSLCHKHSTYQQGNRGKVCQCGAHKIKPDRGPSPRR